MTGITSFRASNQRYGFLRAIGFALTVLGAVMLAIGVALLVFGLSGLMQGTQGIPGLANREAPALATPPGSMWWSAFLPLFWSFGFLLSGFQFIGLGGLFRLMIHLEENTRASAQILDQIRSHMVSGRDAGETLFRS
jgi:hypothetical protein